MKKLYDNIYLEKLQDFFCKTKQRSFELLEPKKGESIVDVGCGVGTDAISMSQVYDVNVIGIDHDKTFIKLAMEKKKKLNVNFVCCEANEIPIQKNSIDKVRFDRVFQHIPNQNEVLAEIRRILKPNGIIQIIDTDYLSFKLFLEDKNLEKKLIKIIAFKKIPNGHTISKLDKTLDENGFFVQTKEIHNYHIKDPEFANFIIRFDKIINEEFQSGNISHEELSTWKRNRQIFNLSLDLIIYQAEKL